MKNSELVQKFIEEIWNNNMYEKIDDYLHPKFRDYSLPPTIEGNIEGTLQWIKTTGLSFEHNTEIESSIEENDLCVIRIKMQLKHIGYWRTHSASNLEFHTNGFRQFQVKEGKIIAHWALIDGEKIENTIGNFNKACAIK